MYLFISSLTSHHSSRSGISRRAWGRRHRRYPPPDPLASRLEDPPVEEEDDKKGQVERWGCRKDLVADVLTH